MGLLFSKIIFWHEKSKMINKIKKEKVGIYEFEYPKRKYFWDYWKNNNKKEEEEIKFFEKELPNNNYSNNNNYFLYFSSKKEEKNPLIISGLYRNDPL